MADTPFPIPRQIRQTGILNGDGGATYGPFAFKIFDPEDVIVYARAAGEVAFASVDGVTVMKVNGNTAANPYDTFRITFPGVLPASAEFVVTSKRTAERSAAVKRGTQLDITALEKEISKLASAGQELRRDINRAVASDFGAPVLTIAGEIADGATLMKQGGRLVGGPDIALEAKRASDAADLARQYASDAAVVSGVNVPIYASVASASGATIAAGVEAIQTQFFAPLYPDPSTLVGGARYHRVASEPGHSFKFRSQDRWMPAGDSDAVNGGWWEIDERAISPAMGGGSLAAAASAANAVNAELDATGAWTTANLRVAGLVRGRSAASARIARPTGVSPALRVDNPSVTVERLTIDNQASAGSRAGHVVRVTGDDFCIRDSVIKDFGSMPGSSGGGTGVLVMPDVNRPQRPRLSDLYIKGNPEAEISIGWLFSDTDYGFVSHVFAEDIIGSTGIGYAHEVKQAGKWTNMHALTARNSEVALAYGQEDVPIGGGAAYNIATGVLADGVDNGIVAGKSVGNVTVGAVIHADGRPGQTAASYGVHLVDTQCEFHAGINNFGTSVGSRGVSINGASEKNYVQIANHAADSSYVRLSGTSRANVVDVVHPGDRASLVGTFTDTSGAPTHGTGANVIYSQATGEQFGTLSGRYRWFLGGNNTAFNSGHRFQMARDGTAVLAFGTPDDTSMTAGIVHATPTQDNAGGLFHSLGATRDADTWYMSGWGTGTRYAWGMNVYRANVDNTVNLGSSTLRWKNIYAGTGTINTSDAREKTDPLPIDDAVLDAWADVRLIAYQWLDAVASKGELARIHHGVIAQQVRDAFSARGLDGTRYGLLCHDAWEAQPEVKNEDGNTTQAALQAGDRWGIRADQCLWVEAAFQRRRCDRIEARLAVLEAAGG